MTLLISHLQVFTQHFIFNKKKVLISMVESFWLLKKEYNKPRLGCTFLREFQQLGGGQLTTLQLVCELLDQTRPFTNIFQSHFFLHRIELLMYRLRMALCSELRYNFFLLFHFFPSSLLFTLSLPPLIQTLSCGFNYACILRKYPVLFCVYMCI